MVTTYGTSSDISHFFRTQGNLFVPILADLTVYSIFYKSRDYHASEIAGAITGIAAYFVFAQRTSLSVNLLGAAVYLAYKVTHYFYASMSVLTAQELLEKRYREFSTMISNISTSEEQLSLRNDQEAELIMSEASMLIRKKIQEAEEAVELDSDSRNEEIANQLDDDFNSLINIFCGTFNLIKQRAKQVLSEGLSKPEKQAKEEIINLFCKNFGPCNRMNNLYFSLYCDLSPLTTYLPKDVRELLRENDPDMEVILQEAEQEEEQSSDDSDNLPVPEAD
ncbi:MAG: hypothetical protein JSS10_00205 [Verrucomicrobia bacterium]|nr:hypothetical protein [Verrucomicrobiota bacterium]